MVCLKREELEWYVDALLRPEEQFRFATRGVRVKHAFLDGCIHLIQHLEVTPFSWVGDNAVTNRKIY